MRAALWAGDVASVSLRSDDGRVAAPSLACDGDATVGPLAPGPVTFVVEASGLRAACSATVAPGRTTVARCAR